MVGSEKIALELVEGWCVLKIGMALVAALLVSAFSASLRTSFWGARGCALCLLRNETQTGFRNTGRRLETNAMLGLLVLLLEWTAFGGWVFLSWLV